MKRILSAPMPDGWSPAIVLVDDHSEAAHRATLDELVATLRSEDIEVRSHDHNRGKGAAVRTGFDAILAAGPPDDDLVIIQDADLEYDPSDYRRLMEPLLNGDADAVIGSRWGDHRQISGLKRRLHGWGNSVLTRCSNLMTGFRLRDMECCYKLFTIELLRRLRPWMSEARYGVEPQMVAALARLGARVSEVAVSYDPRSVAEGKKIGWRDGVRALYVIARERRRRRPPEPPR